MLSPSPSISACRRLYAVGLVIRKYKVFEIALDVVSDPAIIARSPKYDSNKFSYVFDAGGYAHTITYGLGDGWFRGTNIVLIDLFV